ncbi:hypothetical protein F4678DRAFT_475256 [Xylaria arbuscula]|nr:hypothetical protein F4678DRAFT_475256 [Xylaria arbuscula]
MILSAVFRGSKSQDHQGSDGVQRRKTPGGIIPSPALESSISERSDTQLRTLSQQVDEAAWHNNQYQSPQLADTFLQSHPFPPPESRTSQLSLPVVITQRRPGKRARGFVRTYAPILNDVGTTEATFLEFMDDLNKAATNVANAAHSRYKTNHFLHQINNSFFMPRGLIALVMTWKPSEPGQMMTDVNLDMDPAIASATKQDEQGSLKKMKNKFAQSNGAMKFEWPETAPLVFPVLDNLSDADTRKKKNILKHAGAFVGEYMDSRSRAQWAGQNLDSKMANADLREQFHSRYSDPNHPASSGDPLALLTGGHLQSFIGGRSRGIFPHGVNQPVEWVLGGAGVVAGAVQKIFDKLPPQEEIAQAAGYRLS